MPTKLNIMRLSPVLVVFLATSATFGLSTSVKGQTANGTLLAQGLGTPQPLSPGDQSTPIQATPDQIQLTPTPASPPPTLTIPPEAKPTPAPTTAPQEETPTTPTPEQSVPPTPTPEPAAPTAPGTAPEGQPAPTAPPGATPEGQPAPTTPDQTTAPEPRVLVAEVLVSGVEGTYQEEVYRAIRTQPGRTTTRSQLQEDINAIFATGYFSNVQAVPEDTPLGVRVTFVVQLNPVLKSVQIEGKKVLPDQVVQDAFSDQYGNVLNLVQLQDGIKKVNKWYQDNGYVLAQVVDAPKVSPDGVVTLEVAEGVVENIQVRFVNKEGDDKDAKGNPIRGKTRPFIVTREFELKPGDVFNRATVERDLQRVYGLGIFDDVKLSLNPGEDPRKVVVVANVVEKNTGSIAAGAGISSASGLFGTVSYQQQNIGGNNQKLGAEVQIGERELLFDLSFTDPWIGGDPFRTSYTVNLFRRQTISLIFDGGPDEVRLANGDRPRVVRTGGGISFSRPLNGNPYRRSEWAASVGLQYQHVQLTDADGNDVRVDELGNNLSFSGEGDDDLFSLQFGVVRDQRDDPLRPTRGSLLRIGTEQWLPLGSGSILGNRLRAGYSYYIPAQFIQFTPGCRKKNPTGADCPQTIAFNLQGGTVLGDLPPYEAFALGGSNSVRGYDEGDLAAARSFIQGTIEYRFPIFSIISGAVFFDAATDFGTQGDVPGNPGGVRGKPGSGFGYGIGVRVQSPLGPIRIDYGINDEGDSRIHFGIGERF
ncbi:BamA/TamA family outer membrane protein [Kovacikia minuta CCNUW1]|uniref:BamA/TamA family outer membrane protein n=1 Tax=Kovacikia minuta TaxID=2931930 RepID=UPI001CCB5659|nr:BamA/TamA family outer membrane protein [Kovacikia minuta]UBF27385.1 BamA/TamA family outer membrane protein [Kovacikia minuta CCNUW1]